MTEHTRNLLDQALKLDPTERAVLAAELTASLDASAEADDDEVSRKAWLAEIERRVRRAQSGASEASDWVEVQARIEERLRRVRA